MKQPESDDSQISKKATLSDELVGFLSLFGHIINKSPGDIIGDELHKNSPQEI